MNAIHAGVYTGVEANVPSISSDSVKVLAVEIYELPRMILPSVKVNRFGLNCERSRR